jgi:beta-phosphoglucomutase-like phosphatase (HAD superfamily)
MSDVNRLVSEFVRAANTADDLSAVRVSVMLDDAIEAIRQLRHATNIIPIPTRDALIYIRTVAAGSDSVPSDEWRHALLHAAEMIRDLSIVIDSGTVTHILPDVPNPATSAETAHAIR